MTTRFIPFVALIALLPAAAAGQELRGSLGLEARSFPQSPGFGEQRDATISPSLVMSPKVLWDPGDGDVQLTFRPFVRLDVHDQSRTHFDVREASALHFADDWTVFGGIGRVFWGKTEAHHLVDIINQSDGVEDVDNEDKLGQPMLNLTLERGWGALDLFYLPYFRERTFPGDNGRLRGALPVLDGAVYESEAGRWHPDFAARWSHYLGDMDVAVSAFRGTSREPRLVPTPADAGLALQAHYDVIDQLSLEAQWTHGPTLWKLESMTRGGHGDRFVAAVLGIEHTLFGLASGPSDLGLLAEVMLDGRGDDAPYTVFDNDVFLGARWARNDEDDTSLLGGPVIDMSTGELIAFVEAERRLASRWTLEVQARWFANVDAEGPLYGLRRDDFLALRVNRHF